ncbi:unnamed protein product, partial [Discosporangium mesarthrocarpum]
PLYTSVPGLTTKPFWGPADLPWMKKLECGFDDVRGELLSLRGRKAFQVRGWRPGQFTLPFLSFWCLFRGEWQMLEGVTISWGDFISRMKYGLRLFFLLRHLGADRLAQSPSSVEPDPFLIP